MNQKSLIVDLKSDIKTICWECPTNSLGVFYCFWGLCLHEAHSHSVHSLSAGGGGGGVQPVTKFSKRGEGLDRISIFRGGLLGKRE